MSQLPAHWRLVTLNDLQADESRAITDGPFGSHLTSAHYTDSGPRVVRLQNIGDGVFHNAPAHISEQHFESLRAHEVLPGDLLVASLGETLPRACLTPPTLGPAIVKADCIRVRLSPGVDSRWVMYALQRPEVRKWAEEHRHGVGRPRLGLKVIRQIPVPLPPPNEQRRIVDILEDHLSRLDAGAGYLATGAQKADAMCRAVLEAAMCGKLVEPLPNGLERQHQLELRSALCPTGMKRGRPEPAPTTTSEEFEGWPSHWTRVSLEEATHPVRTISYGILKPGPDIEGGVPYVRVVNMRDDRLSLEDLHRTTPEIARQYERATLVPDDVLVSIRGTYGRVVVVPEALRGGNITQDTARLAFVGPVIPEFAAIYLRSPQAQGYMKRVARGVAVKGVNIGDLRIMPFPIPPLFEQQAIIARVAELTSELDAARRTMWTTGVRSKSLRRALFDTAFSGRLTGRVSDMDVVEEMAGV